MPDYITTIRHQNDRFRLCDPTIPGRMVIADSLLGHLAETGAQVGSVVQLVREYSEFTDETDPYGEHDMGKFELAGATCYWKIDLFNADYEFGTRDPTDLSETRRVLTIMLATDY